MSKRFFLMSGFAVSVLTLGACSTVEDLIGFDSGHVKLSCAGTAPAAGVPLLKDSLSPLAPGTVLEIVRAEPQNDVIFTLPQASAGDDFAYQWKEASAGAGRPPGTWLCRVEWQSDGKLWQLTHLDSRWVGGAVATD